MAKKGVLKGKKTYRKNPRTQGPDYYFKWVNEMTDIRFEREMRKGRRGVRKPRKSWFRMF